GVAWGENRRADAELDISCLRCRVVILGNPTTLQLVSVVQQQLEVLAQTQTDRVFALQRGATAFVPVRLYNDGKRPAKVLNEDGDTLSRIVAIRVQTPAARRALFYALRAAALAPSRRHPALS
ncbi:unnamed protein product, partial [Symbiodinium necroappetens]